MASTSSHALIQEDDDFDWEAAVREIDSACLATKPATSAPIQYKPLFGSRQSTLDEFVRKSVPTERRIQEENEVISGVRIDPEAAQTWIYPVNIPLRDYQLSITRTALFSNTLVALPTGLGKTLIAAVVMYNYFRWFPEGKIIFAAPSRPLVMQQIEACHNIVGIPQDWTIDMTGQVNPSARVHLWKAKRVFFVTPQVLENDIRSGTCLAKDLVCLVIDEAHRASGNYSYCVAVRELMNIPVQLRILALTATPGSKQQAIQQVIDNLQMSTLEYRTESDPDVSPYVHDRKIELIEVAMGPDAIEITNFLMEVARPFVTRLSAMGVLLNRDFKTLSPCDFLNARDTFRQAPPLDLPQIKYGEVEGFLGVLITLYHILKLLSSHGIRPAYEMLVEKSKQGPFARYLSRNEILGKAKYLMHQTLSHGAPSPKLSKMLEVLNDHFRKKDPLNSRVIIFSNFRGSVRDIMDALSTLGERVKATQFIGQSSGKTLKGQSQKAQQAVLEKFRAGGYNVIVATSIGEEGLDIMEVDLVICFDANVSPLRMIQRMGRTGRKNDGRVVVLACEGAELKGYKRKQGSSNTIKKLLRNGGMNSFNFHPSPRMIPHIFKPEVKLVELSIEQFVPRGKKVKDDQPSESPSYNAKLTDEESNLIAKYFGPTKDRFTWRPSLIAFPHFQAFPSRVHNVRHSVRTGILIDAMISLQDLSYTRDSDASNREDQEMPDLDMGVTNALQQENCVKDSWISHDSPEECILEKTLNYKPLVTEDSETVSNDPPIHSFLFGSDFVSVDSFGNVIILPVPLLPLEEIHQVKFLKKDSSQLESSFRDNNDISRVKNISEPITVDYECDNLKDDELSPRLSNFIQRGFVPESPVACAGDNGRETWISPDLVPSCVSNIEASPNSSPILVQKDDSESKVHIPATSVKDEFRTPLPSKIKCNLGGTSVVVSPILEQCQAHLADSLSGGCSRDRGFSPGKVPGSFQQKRKLKRLRKYGDKDEIGPKRNKTQARTKETPLIVENCIEKRKRTKDARAFIEEEAEVSSEVEVSDDEEDAHEINSSYEDSFIDDKIDPTATTSTQAESNPCDMMAIYRHSLLSQSPIVSLSNSCTDHSPDLITPNSRLSHSTTSSRSLSNNSFRRYNLVPETESIENFSSESIPCRESDINKENEDDVLRRKRKLSFSQVPSVNLESRFASPHDRDGREIYKCATQGEQEQKIEINGNAFEDDDDKFYEGLDLDALEEEAAKLLQHKLESPLPKRMILSEPKIPEVDLKECPSFDLGI